MEQTLSPSRFGNSCRKSGFTLVELLVVIVIIAVLAAIAVFATRSVRQKAYQVKALNTIRQVSPATASFSLENNGDIANVLYDGDTRLGGGRWITKNWWGSLAPFLFSGLNVQDTGASKNEIGRALNSLFSTTFPTKVPFKAPNTFQQGAEIYSDTSGLPLPFAFNANTQDWGKYKKMSSFPDPSQVIHFTYGWNNFNQSRDIDYKEIPNSGLTKIKGVHYFKNKTGVFVFLDGHVEILSPPIPARRFTATP
ncbi:MAG TPA: type II secretion system protein [Candidatus Paceibacterota bacterium]|nr:type II secretion system protein [Candidatus Paceibacterota bacterium]